MYMELALGLLRGVSKTGKSLIKPMLVYWKGPVKKFWALGIAMAPPLGDGLVGAFGREGMLSAGWEEIVVEGLEGVEGKDNAAASSKTEDE